MWVRAGLQAQTGYELACAGVVSTLTGLHAVAWHILQLLARATTPTPHNCMPCAHECVPCVWRTTPHLHIQTGVPVLADSAFLQAYSMLSPATVFEQHAGEDELAAMFRVARLPSEHIWSTRAALHGLRGEMNGRCVQLLKGWLLKGSKGV